MEAGKNASSFYTPSFLGAKPAVATRSSTHPRSFLQQELLGMLMAKRNEYIQNSLLTLQKTSITSHLKMAGLHVHRTILSQSFRVGSMHRQNQAPAAAQPESSWTMIYPCSTKEMEGC